MLCGTVKFSQFVPDNVDRVVGLTNGQNVIGQGGGGGGTGVTQTIIQNNNFSKDQWIRFDEAMNEYVTALATTPQNAEVIGVVIDRTDTQFTVQQSGYITSAQAVFSGLEPGKPYFLSDAVSGAMVADDVIIDGEVSRPVFLPDTASSGWVLPYRGIIAGGGPDTGGGPSPTPGTDSNIVTIVQNMHGLAAKQWVRVTTPQAGPQVHYVLADASTLERSQAVGVVIHVIDDNTFVLQFAGYLADGTDVTAPDKDQFGVDLVPGTPYYLSSTVNSGALVSVDPSAAGFISKPLYICEQTTGTVNKNAGYVLPQRPIQSSQEDNPIKKTITQTNHGFTMIGTVVKPSISIAGFYIATDATSFTKSYGTGMIVDIPDVNTFVIQEVGYVEGLDVAPSVPMGSANSATPFTKGVPYYLATDVLEGKITSTEPASPNFSKPMFMPDNVGSGWILPMKPTIGHGGGGGGGGVTFLQSTTVNASAFAFLEGSFSSTYNSYLIIIDNLLASGITYLKAQLGYGPGPTYVTFGPYNSRADSIDYTGGGNRSFLSTTSFILNSAISNFPSSIGSGNYTLYNTNVDLGSNFVQITGQFTGGVSVAYQGGRNFGGCDMGGVRPVTAIRFFANAGTISGRFSLYGISH